MSKRILAVDDSKTMRDMLNFTLVNAGYEVTLAVDGNDGLSKLKGQAVDLIITDKRARQVGWCDRMDRQAICAREVITSGNKGVRINGIFSV